MISAELLSQSGHTELYFVLTQEVPSFNFPQPSITDGTDAIFLRRCAGSAPTRHWC